MRKTAAGRPSSPSDHGPASFRMTPKYHPTPLSGGDRKALKKELGTARAMTGILAKQAEELRAKGNALIRQADALASSQGARSQTSYFGCGQDHRHRLRKDAFHLGIRLAGQEGVDVGSSDRCWTGH